MTPEEWQRIRPILESALELDPARRPAFLDGACEDPFLRREVESLINSHEQAGTNVLEPGSAVRLKLDEEAQFRLLPGKHIGVYEIAEEIAVGGMGAVYRAIRADGQYKQQVALKIVRSELGAESTATRFRNERQILASLDHPNIAKILDGGTTTDGLPYFVMEFIDGLPITEYCDRNRLTIDERLKILRTVCSAVHYAHQHLVIHRDIKPGNILITSDGAPKLLDFGIAKILDPSLLAENAAATLAGLWVMTPEYASPEQLRGEAITTATDVYSLGLVLYELLAGHRAYRLSSHLPHEIARAVLETDPEKPSTAIRRKDEIAEQGKEKAPLTPELISGLRADSPEKLHRRIARDLDNIVMKAIRKDPRERYSSADQLSEDIRRHLEHLPVLARRSTVAYRCRKYVLRHKVGVAAATLVFLSLLTGIALTLREARIARANQLRAEQRFNDVRALANALIFDVHDSIKDLPGSTPARKLIVDRALQYLNSLAGESRGDLSLQRELASAYERVGMAQGHYLESSLGDTQGSLVSYRRALQIRQQVAEKSSDWNDRLAFAQSHRLVANQQWATGDKRAAREHIDSAIAISESLSTVHFNDLKILRELALDYSLAGQIGYTGPFKESGGQDENYRRAVSVEESMLRTNPDDLETQYRYAIDLSHLAGIVEVRDAKASLPYYMKELQILQKLHQRSPDIRYARGVARAYGELASAYDRAGDYQHALENERHDLAIYQELTQVDPKNNLLQRGLAIEYGNAATRLSELGNTRLSLSYMQKGLEMMRAIVAGAPQNLEHRIILGQFYMASGSNLMRARQPEAALRDFSEAYAIYEAFHQSGQGDVGASVNAAACIENMGKAAALEGNAKLAANYFHQALAVVEPLLSAAVPDLDALYTAADAYSGLGDLKFQQARSPEQSVANRKANWTEARSWYLKSLAAWRRIEHPAHSGPNSFEVGDPAKVAENLHRCDAALAKLTTPNH